VAFRSLGNKRATSIIWSSVAGQFELLVAQT
jgi:hypothetical protein